MDIKEQKKRIWILTLFPEFFAPLFQCGVIAKSLAQCSIHLINIRDFSTNNYKSVDDTPFGGAPGMIMRSDILKRAFTEGILAPGGYPLDRLEWQKELLTIYTSPRGKTWNQHFAKETAKELMQGRDLAILCGRYEGIDERFLQNYIEREYSLGDFVLSGGEIAALAFLDSTLRLLPGVLGNQASLTEESFEDDLLEGPQYTKPREFEETPVPAIYLSGNHKAMELFRHQERLRITKQFRPDLYERYLEKSEENSEEKKK